MVGRVKFQVWGKHGWCTAYCKTEMVSHNIMAFLLCGIGVRVDGLQYIAAKHYTAQLDAA